MEKFSVTPERLKEEFIKMYGAADGIRMFASPARINIIGEHIDYNGGKVFPAAIDKYFDKGSVSDHGLQYEIGGTKDQIIYQTERWSSETLTYSLPLTDNGKYTLILKFSEVYFQRKGEKVFDIALGNRKIIYNLDIFLRMMAHYFLLLLLLLLFLLLLCRLYRFSFFSYIF